MQNKHADKLFKHAIFAININKKVSQYSICDSKCCGNNRQSHLPLQHSFYITIIATFYTCFKFNCKAKYHYFSCLWYTADPLCSYKCKFQELKKTICNNHNIFFLQEKAQIIITVFRIVWMKKSSKQVSKLILMDSFQFFISICQCRFFQFVGKSIVDLSLIENYKLFLSISQRCVKIPVDVNNNICTKHYSSTVGSDSPIETNVTGYIQAISPVKKATFSSTRYFNCNIQKKDQVVRAVCFNLAKRPNLYKYEQAQTAVTLHNVRSTEKDGIQSIIIQNNTTMEPVTLPFAFQHAAVSQSLPSIASLQEVSVEQLVQIKAKVSNISGIKQIATRYG